MSDVHVQVRIGEELYALPVSHVIEIGEIGQLTVAPGASRAILGLHNLRGDLLPVFDFAAVLGLPSSGAATRMLVAERREVRAGFAVDAVTDVDALPDADQQVDSALVSSAVLVDGSLIGVVDVDRLFDALESAA